jgi:ATP-binding cassette subfamily C protein CydCD
MNKLKSRIFYFDLIKKHLVIQTFLALISSAITIFFAISVANYFVNKDSFVFLLSLCALAVVKYLNVVAKSITSAKSFNKVRSSVTDSLLNKIQRLPSNELNVFGKSRISTVLSNGVDRLENYYADFVPAFIEVAVVPTVTLFFIFLIEPSSGFIILFTIPLIPIFMILVGVFTKERQERQWNSYQRLKQSFSSLIVGIPTLKLLGKDRNIFDYASSLFRKYNNSVMKTLKVAFLSVFVLEALATLSIAIVAVTLGVRLTNGSVSIFAAVFVLFAVPECYWPLRRLGSTFHSSEEGHDAAVEINELLKLPELSQGTVSVNKISEIKASGVKVYYGDQLALGTQNFTILPNEFYVVVGPNGSGKTTFFKLLLKRLEHEDGSLTLNNIDINELSADSIHEQITWIPQEQFLLDQTGIEAITSNHDFPPELVEQVCKELGIAEVVAKPLSQLSGGQVQRVHIAVALLKIRNTKTSVLLADEPTSFLDSENRKIILNEMKSFCKRGNIVIVASHSEEVIKEADTIIELVKPNIHKADSLTLQIEKNASSRRKITTNSDGLSSADEYSFIKKFLSKIKLDILKSSLMNVIVEFFALSLAAVSVWLVLKATEKPLFAELALAALFVRITSIGKSVFRYLERLTTHKSALNFSLNIREESLKKIVKLAPGRFSELRSAQTIKRVIDDHEDLEDLYIRSAVPFLSNLIIGILASGVFFFFVNSASGFTVLFLTIFVASALTIISFSISNKSEKSVVRDKDQYHNSVLDLVNSIDLFVANNEYVNKTESLKSITVRYYNSQLRQWKKLALIKGALNILGLVAIILIFLQVDLTAFSMPVRGMIFLFPIALFQVFEENHKIGDISARGILAIRRVKEIHEREPLGIETKSYESHDFGLVKGEYVSLKNSTFQWDENNRIEDVSFLLENETNKLNIVGPSGSGKSTIAAGLVRFLELENGEYRICGFDAESLAPEIVRKSITLLLQNSWLFNGTLRENLLLADPELDEKAMVGLLKQVGYVCAENDLDKQVGINGENLSGGERQKIMLARLFAQPHSIKILDEPTTFLDVDSTAKVIERLNGTNEKIIVLAHDPFLENGEVITTVR